MKNENFRYIRLFASVVTMLCIGIIYMWSVFGGFVINEFGWSRADSAMTASVMIACYSIGALVGGNIQDKIGPKKVVIGGSIGFFLGVFLSSMTVAVSPMALYVTFGVLGGFSVGCIYNSIVASTQKWFPDKMSVVTGVNAMAFGLSTLVFSAIVTGIAGNFGIQSTFRIISVVFLVVCLVASIFITNPPAGWKPKAFEGKGDSAGHALSGKQYTLSEALRTRQFWTLWISVLLLTSGFFVFNPILKQLAMGRGIDDATAVLAVMLVGVGMALGRLLFPFVVNKVGQKKTALILAALVIMSSLSLIFAQGHVFIVSMFIAAGCAGAPGAIWPTWTAVTFGLKNNGSIFGFILLAIGVSSLVSFKLADAIGQAVAGGSDVAYYIYAAITALLAMLLIVSYRPLKEGR